MHVRKSYQCNQSSKSFIEDSSLIKQMEVHTKENSEKTYSSKSNESFTMGKYQCSQCDICFSTERSLNQHAGMHTGENSKECNINNDMGISNRENI